MIIIGQNNLLNRIQALIDNDKMPRFFIFSGMRGSGKKLILKEIANKMNIGISMCDYSIDSVRDIISTSYASATKHIYVIQNAEKMSQSAQNALLKIAEEPPRNAHICLLTDNYDALLATVRSRAVVFTTEMYEPRTLQDYALDNYVVDDSLLEIIMDCCETPGEVKMLINQGGHDFYKFVSLVVDNIATVSGGNSFKIADKIALKDEEGYDLILFWKMFISILISNMKHSMNSDEITKLFKGIYTTSAVLQELRIGNINKQMLFDKWILDIRNEWL